MTSEILCLVLGSTVELLDFKVLSISQKLEIFSFTKCSSIYNKEKISMELTIN